MVIQKCIAWCVRLIEIVIGLMLSAVLIVAMGEVLSRYFLGHSLAWVTELSRFLFIWMSLLAAAVAFHYRMHFRVVLLWRAITPKIRPRLELAIDAISFVFALVLLTLSLPIILGGSRAQFCPRVACGLGG
jgi:TRAP-type C4-dicarboxylate transport system permease small subunit